MVRIRFSSERDEVKGFYLLATNARIRGLRGGVYEVSQPALALLDQNHFSYEVIPPTSRTANDTEALRNPLTVEL